MIFRQKYVWGALKKENYLARVIGDNCLHKSLL